MGQLEARETALLALVLCVVLGILGVMCYGTPIAWGLLLLCNGLLGMAWVLSLWADCLDWYFKQPPVAPGPRPGREMAYMDTVIEDWGQTEAPVNFTELRNLAEAGPLTALDGWEVEDGLYDNGLLDEQPRTNPEGGLQWPANDAS